MVRTGTCRTLLCRVHRYLLNTAFIVCLMGRTAVQTSVAQGFLAAQATLFHVLMPIETSRNVHMKKLENLLSLRTPDTLSTIDLAGSQGLEGMKVDTVKPQKIVFVFPLGHGVIVFIMV